jgi:predicted alpha/beta hydrolase
MNTSPPCHILVLPALGVPAPVYAPLLQALAALPQTHAQLVALPAAEGSWRALWSARHQGYLSWLEAVEAQVRQTRQADPGARVLLLGHSIGGHVALLALARRVVDVDGLVLVAAGTPHWRAWPPEQQARMRHSLRAVAAVLRLWPWYPGDWLGFGGRQPRQLMRDWLGLARTGRFDAMAGLAGIGAKLQQARGAVLAIDIEGDSLAPPAATRKLRAHAPRLEVEQAVASNERLQRESSARRHNLWPREPQAVLPHLQRWLQARWPAAPADKA